jgi:signal transduction histidine kinase
MQVREAATPRSFDREETTEALEEELTDLRERSYADLEAVQLGMALGVIRHEFRNCTKTLRDGFRSLRRWADTNPSLATLYTNLRTSFDHLDGYLSLFTPLTRRLNRTKIEIHGYELAQFLDDLFVERLRRHSVTLTATPSFKEWTIVEYPSSVYPCFVNLVDNAVFWLSDWKGERHITVDRVDQDVLVSDTGPGIKPRDQTAVFERGFSRRPGGQGLGLFVCKATLARVGLEITLDPYVKGKGATFRIGASADPKVEVHK